MNYDGPHAFIDMNEASMLGILPGYYALNKEGNNFLSKGRKKHVRLVMVDDAPGDPDNGACHLEIAEEGDPITRPGNVVPVEFHGRGRAKVNE